MSIDGRRPLRVTTMFLMAALVIPCARDAVAQGLSGASIEGIVVADTGSPVGGATVTLTGRETGVNRMVTSDPSGTFRFENVEIGYYRIDVRHLGLAPTAVDSVTLHLGDHLRVRLVMMPRAQDLGTTIVGGTSLRNPGSGGPAQSIPREAVKNLPLANRDFVGLFALSPQAVGPGSLSVSGQHSRFNAIQIDGAIGNDLFGVNVTSGSSAGGKSVSLEALDEIRILVAPFDVRQGGFSGGLINAVTRSGTNNMKGAVFTSYGRSELVGPDTAGAGIPTFDQLQYGVSVGGPIVRDRLHYFIAAESQRQATQFTGQPVTDTATGITAATVNRAARVFRDNFGFNPGGPEAPDISQPNSNIFAKLSWQPTPHHFIDLTQSVAQARSDQLNRLQRNSSNSDGWQLSNSGSASKSASYSTRIKATSAYGAITNEVLAGISRVYDRVDSRNSVPLFLVQADALDTYLAAGSVKGAQATRTGQHVTELTDNLSWSTPRHLVTLGTQNVFVHVRDNFMPGEWGVWAFGSVDSLERNEPSRYEISLRREGAGVLADAKISLLSAYAQDQWRPVDRLLVTAGLRIDDSFFSSPRRNDALANNAALGNIDTRKFPSGNAIVSPRVALALDVGSSRRTMLRAGAGAFSGRPPLAWLTGAFSTTGRDQTTLVCTATDGVPRAVSDIRLLPTSCIKASGTAKPLIGYFDQDFRFQRAIKFDAGVDHDFGSSVLGSLDVVYTTSRDNLFLTDANLVQRGTNSEGRAMYGTIAASGSGRPTRLDSVSYGQVFRFSNVDSDRSTSISASLQRRWGTSGMASAGYSWSRSTDVMSVAGFNSMVMSRNNPVDGTLTQRNRRRSARDIPHSFVAAAVVPFGNTATGSMFFRAHSGTPYAFTVNGGDANADGIIRNDLSYVPRSLSDFSLSNPEAWPALDSLIETVPCLRSQRGAIMKRNSCRNPFVWSVDGRISKRLSSRNGRGFEVSADFFNIPNLLNRHWGLVRETSNREDVPLIPVTGWDAVNNRPRYSARVLGGSVLLPAIDKVVPDASRWRIQMGARYDF